ncbi:sugar phosphotransferase [Pediococcus acidilactici]|nr:sugar phosphotransferase [Pediococcus acidilactici]NBI15254.1 sugar phosphotransferase [Pediococcus acidilactici]NFA45743.1 sugar phosphotransferase [Pediococcus acidilactici]NFA48050.1 sugar phosphotransferase [Pediococcus acidilactici]NFA88441.1 sugar phosphotransferase [Pediococcus acidilactici]
MVMDFKIDFVVSWVNGQDPKWLKKYIKYKDDDTLDVKNARFRDYGIFKYWFRAVEQNAPWVNHIYLVTDSQKPSWLEDKNSKITVIDHSEIINEQYRPVFNSNAIELNLYKIKNLEEHFVYFNDDMFLNKPVKPTDFFSKSGLPKDTAGLNAIQPLYDFDYIHTNNMRIINQEFDKKKVMRKQFFKFINPINLELNIYTMLLFFWPKFTRFFDLHYPYSFLKSNMKNVIEENNEAYTKTMNDRFRNKNDISIWLVRYYSLVQGDFSIRSPRVGKIYDLKDDYRKALLDVKKSKHKMIVLNDDSKIDEALFGKISKGLIDVFNVKYPLKSSFEKGD